MQPLGLPLLPLGAKQELQLTFSALGSSGARKDRCCPWYTAPARETCTGEPPPPPPLPPLALLLLLLPPPLLLPPLLPLDSSSRQWCLVIAVVGHPAGRRSAAPGFWEEQRPEL